MQNGSGAGAGSSAVATYRSFRSHRGLAAMGDINVTPLVDVVLVLLLVFMVTAPMMNRGMDVSLPVANQRQIQPEDRVVVTVRADERVFLDGKLVSVADLPDQLRLRFAASSK